MKVLAFALLLVASSAGVAAADGWIDCNGPDKNGRGCDTSGTSGATTGAGLLLVSAVAYAVARKRR